MAAALLSVVAVAITAGRDRRSPALLARWAATVEALGCEDTSDHFSLRMAGSDGPWSYEVDYPLTPTAGSRETTVTILGDFPPGLSLKMDYSGSTIPLDQRSFLTGDDYFDCRTKLDGDEDLARALMTAEVRETLLSFGQSGILLEGDVLTWRHVGAPEPANYARYIGGLMHLTRALVPAAPLRVLLTENACRDPQPEVRLRNLELLAREPDTPEVLAAARCCLESEDAVLAMRAALLLGDEGLGRLEELLSADALPPLMRVEALTALGCRGQDGLLALTGHPALDVRLVAVRALARCGTLSAVEPLTLFQQGIIFPEERTAARRSIDAIQARHGGERGAFSLLPGEAGALALVDAEGGVGDVSIVGSVAERTSEEADWKS